MPVDPTLLQKQFDLEGEAVALGIRRYRKAVAERPLSEQPPGIILTKLTIEPLTKAINEFIESSGVGRLASTRRMFLSCNPEEMAYIICRCVLNSLSVEQVLQAVAIEVADAIHTHVEYVKFKTEKPDVLKYVEDRVLNTAHKRHRETVILLAKRRQGIEDTKWTKEARLHFGSKCIDLFIQATGMVTRHLVKERGKMKYVLLPTEKTKAWIEKQHAHCELLQPFHLPMVIPPVDWVSPYDGGFLGHAWEHSTSLIKTSDKKALGMAEETPMPAVYQAVNTLQRTPWRINTRVLDVLKTVFETGRGMAGLPEPEDLPMPPKSWTNDEEFQWLKENQPDIVREWKTEAKRVHDYNKRMPGKRYAKWQQIQIASKFREEAQIYFCWTTDWRGRCYPMQGFVQPQGDDTGKALLEFAEGKSLTERGAYWLAVHLANEYGYDKASFDDRVRWVHDHEAMILDSASNPLDGSRGWVDADSPFMFLAACFEWERYKAEGPSVISHLPVGVDGTCNGLQHFAALLRDEVGGKAVNLIPQEKPADIYQEVANIAYQRVIQDAASGVEFADLWAAKGIDRKMAKRNVMTVPYGVTQYGMRDQLRDELISRRNMATGETYLGVKDEFGPAIYLAGVLYDAIGKVVIAARSAMGWLQAVAAVTTEAGVPIKWTTPSGFPVYQSYNRTKYHDIRTFWGKVKINLGLRDDTGVIDKRRQVNSISPNFVHSLDAAALQLTVGKCAEKGVTSFAMIHDSYGTHACDLDVLSDTLRDVFVEMYSTDQLDRFKQEILSQLPEEFWERIPELPTKGTLDLEEVKKSRYFFA